MGPYTGTLDSAGNIIGSVPDPLPLPTTPGNYDFLTVTTYSGAVSTGSQPLTIISSTPSALNSPTSGTSLNPGSTGDVVGSFP